MSWTQAIGIGIAVGPLWGLILCRAVFEWLRVTHLLLGEQFGPYKLYNPKTRTDISNNENDSTSN
jgi:hypothetical protein